MSHLAESLFFGRKPPSNVATSRHVILPSAAGLSAVAFDWPAALAAAGANVPEGDVWLCVEATVSTVYVRFGPATSTGTTAVNGSAVLIAEPRYFYVNPASHKWIDHLAAGANSQLKVYVCSGIGNRSTI